MSGGVSQIESFDPKPQLTADHGKTITIDNWQGRQGYVATAVTEDFADLGAHEVYSSGPPAMVRAAQEAFMAQGLPLEHFYSEPFEFNQDASPGTEAVTD